MRDRCIIGSMLFSDGRHRDKLYVDGGHVRRKPSAIFRMQGKEVFRFAVNAIADVVEETLHAHNLTPRDIDWFVPHQANKRILDGTAKKVGIPPEKVVVTLDRHGNTSAASIPLALVTAVQRRPDQEGRPRPFGGDGRRLHLGSESFAVVEPRNIQQ